MRTGIRTCVIRVFHAIIRIGPDPADSEQLRLQKAVGISTIVFGVIPGLFGIILFLLHYGAVQAALIELVFAILICVTVFTYARSRYFYFYNLYWSVIALLSCLLVTISIGGIAVSGYLALWVLFVPLVARITNQPRYTLIWFLVAFVELFVLVMLEADLPKRNPLPAQVQFVSLIITCFSITGLFLIVLHYFADQNEQLMRIVRKEQAISEGLLLNILPAEIAEKLKRERGIIADSYIDVSILFADIVGFTKFSAPLKPDEVVHMLNEVFSHLDMLVERYGLEKIKTIGDAYMVAAGVPRARPDHAAVLARLALDIQAYARERYQNTMPLNMRIGICSGPVVAGVIGQKKFAYDLWGDTVNTASRMESHGVGGCIQVNEATYKLIESEFTCEYRGVIDVKGKGPMPVWFVTGIKS